VFPFCLASKRDFFSPQY